MIMKGVGLLVGFGLGAVIGAAVGAYLIASDEDKAKWKENVNSSVDKAKQSVDKAKQKIDQVIDENFSGWNKSSV
jgi:gas vesicle protein